MLFDGFVKCAEVYKTAELQDMKVRNQLQKV